MRAWAPVRSGWITEVVEGLPARPHQATQGCTRFNPLVWGLGEVLASDAAACYPRVTACNLVVDMYTDYGPGLYKDFIGVGLGARTQERCGVKHADTQTDGDPWPPILRPSFAITLENRRLSR